MAINEQAYQELRKELDETGVTLVAVSKTKPVADIEALYVLGQRDFGENYVQELTGKVPQLPADVRWHFIGHLQSNKVKYIAPFVHLIHGIDSEKLLTEVGKLAQKGGRMIEVLLQVHIAQEETKFGLDAQELDALMERLSAHPLPGVRVVGLMGMASFSEDQEAVRGEFRQLRNLYDKYAGHSSEGVGFRYLSMGMSGDYKLAVAEGSNMVRIGSLLFGARN
jgi:pyridoxal phosphate enzyme (YggS family)